MEQIEGVGGYICHSVTQFTGPPLPHMTPNPITGPCVLAYPICGAACPLDKLKRRSVCRSTYCSEKCGGCCFCRCSSYRVNAYMCSQQ